MNKLALLLLSSVLLLRGDDGFAKWFQHFQSAVAKGNADFVTERAEFPMDWEYGSTRKIEARAVLVGKFDFYFTDEIKRAMTGLLEPVYKETHLGRAEVRDTFRIKGVGMIAGCMVIDGVIKRDAEVRVLREGVVVYTGRLGSLRRFKEDASEVRSGFECGIGVANFNDVKVGDILECFSMQKMVLAQANA